ALQPIDVLERTWDVHYPPKTLLLKSDGEFHPADRELDSFGFLGGLRRGFRDVSPEDLVRQGVWLAIAAGLVAAIGLTFRRWGRRGLVGLGLLMLIGVAIVFIRPIFLVYLGETV